MTYHELWHQLAQIYDEGEAKAIARMVYEVRCGLSLADLYIGKDTQLSADDQAELQEIAQRLLRHEPVQYILGQTDFCGRTFKVTPHVLIPRPETAELCDWITTTAVDVRTCLDIGTGSGCIAITLAAHFPDAQVIAWDISADALSVARENADCHHVAVTFQQVDILSYPRTMRLMPPPPLNIIVSNPPYICRQEQAAMEANVLQYEPQGALFVPDDDPLLFYRAIARMAQQALQVDGWLYFEMNPSYAEELHQMLHEMGYRAIEVRNDQFGKQRMIRAQR